jgi:hypothetical protein
MVRLTPEIVAVDRPPPLIEIGPDSARRSSDLAPYDRSGGRVCGRSE